MSVALLLVTAGTVLLVGARRRASLAARHG